MPFLPPCVSSAQSRVARTRAPDGADRVAQRRRAAVDVDLVVGDAEVAHRDHRDAGEGLVDLVEIDVGDAPAGLLQHLVIAPTGAVVNLAGSWAWAAWPTMRATGFRPRRSATLWRVMTSAAAPSLMRDGVGGGDRAVLGEGGLEAGDLARRSPLPGCSSSATVVGPLRAVISTATISRSNQPLRCAVWARVRLAMA